LFPYFWNLFVLINCCLFRKETGITCQIRWWLYSLNFARRGTAPFPGLMVSMARKIFVGSLPQSITEDQLRQEFETYGEVEAIFIKDNCPQGKQWAFITYIHPEDAHVAKEATDTKLTFPESERPCDVMLAKNQGVASASTPAMPVEAPRKIFVGSLPDGIQADVVRSEFSKYGLVP